MDAAEFIIATRRLVTDNLVGPGSVHVGGGRIVSVNPVDARPTGVARIDVGDWVVMPGLVDTHVHVNEPGRTEWEGFRTAGRAAAAGGVTTMVVMPLNCTPAATCARTLTAEADAARGKSLVDYGLWGGLVAGNAAELESMWNAGALGFKCFLTDSGVDDFARVSPSDLDSACPVLGRLGAVLLAHAEDPDIIAAARATSGLDASPRSYAAYLASRPPEAELRSIELLIELSRRMHREHCGSGSVHVVHVSTAEALPLLKRARVDGLPLTSETCPHYLSLASEEIGDARTIFKCAPPIRESANREKLWQGLLDATLDMVVSDHSPCPPELKLLDQGDFARSWGGISSLQLGLPVVWTHAAQHGAGFAQLSRWMATAPATLAGIGRFKGRIAPGYDADLVVWDPGATLSVRASELQHRHKITPYDGAKLSGVVQMTFVRGRQVFAGRGAQRVGRLDADGFAEECGGQWVRRRQA